jgi:superfamily II DNA or RNA helicase
VKIFSFTWKLLLTTISCVEIVIKNSFCQIVGNIPTDVRDVLKAVLTYKTDIENERGHLFFQLKMARRHNNQRQYHAIMAKIKHLEDNQYVCWYKDDTFPTGHIALICEALRASGCEFKLTDLRQKPSDYALLRWNNKPYEPRYYQKEMISLGLEHGRGVFESAVGTGKSLIMAYLIMEFKVNSLIIVPTRGLSDQIYNDFVSWFGTNSVQLLDAKKIRSGKKLKPIRIITLQSLGSLKKSGDLETLIRDIDAIHYDEFHHSAASTFTNIIKDLEHVYYRFGYTGTFMRNDNKTLDMWAFLNHALYSYPAWKAIEDGFLTPLNVIVHPMDGKANQDYQKEYDQNYCANPQLLDKIEKICGQVSPTEQVLILVNKKEKSGEVIHKYLGTLGINTSYISGDDDKGDITQAIRDFNDKKIRILIGSSVISEGIDIRASDHLINCKGGKSEIVLVQSVGRVVRLYPDKHVAFLHEFKFENTQYMEAHFEDRLIAIQTNFRPQTVNEVYI